MEPYRLEPVFPRTQKDRIHFFPQDFSVSSPDTPVVLAHIHSALEILYIRSGAFYIQADGSGFDTGPGDVILFRSKTVHRIYSRQTEGSYYVLKIDPDLIFDFSFPDESYEYLLQFTLSDPSSKVLWTDEECRSCSIHQAFENLIRENQLRGYGYDISMKLQVCTILLAMLRSSVPSRKSTGPDSKNILRRIYQTMLYINSHFDENLTAKECSRMAYMSYSYFSRCFQQVSGSCFKDYLNTIRLKHADKALLASDSTVTEIAFSCGFSSASYFISAYKKAKGMTPLEFRRRNQISAQKNP